MYLPLTLLSCEIHVHPCSDDLLFLTSDRLECTPQHSRNKSTHVPVFISARADVNRRYPIIPHTKDILQTYMLPYVGLWCFSSVQLSLTRSDTQTHSHIFENPCLRNTTHATFRPLLPTTTTTSSSRKQFFPATKDLTRGNLEASQ